MPSWKTFFCESKHLNLILFESNSLIHFVKFLIDEKSDISILNNEGSSPMHLCIERGHKEIINYILNIKDVQTKFNLNVRDKYGRTILHLSAIKGYNSIVEKLIHLGVSVHELDNRQWTPLHYASLYSREDIVRTLLAKGADVNAQNNDGWTCTHSCSLQGHQNILKILLEEYGAKLNSRTYNGYTPLHFAVINEHEECIKLLLDNDADTHATDYKRATPFEYALSKNISSLLSSRKSRSLTDPKNCKLTMRNNSSLYVDDEIKFTIQTYDKWNRERYNGKDEVVVIVKNDNQSLQIPIKDKSGKGLYFFSYKAIDIGTYYFDVRINNKSLEDMPIKILVNERPDTVNKDELKFNVSTPLIDLNKKRSITVKNKPLSYSSRSINIKVNENSQVDKLDSVSKNEEDTQLSQISEADEEESIDSLKKQIQSYKHQISILKDELEREKERNSCKSCNQSKECIIVPCYHVLYCRECVKKYSTCPSCEERIVEVINIKFD